MESNYITPNTSPEQRLMLAVTKIIRQLAVGINNILASLEGKTEWYADASQSSELNWEPVKLPVMEQAPVQNKQIVADQAASLGETLQWQYPVLNYKRRKKQVNLDYLLAISG